jgi:hypothetical protein
MGEVERRLDPFDQALTAVRVCSKAKRRIKGHVEPTEVKDEAEDSKESVTFGMEGLWVGVFGEATSFGEDAPTKGEPCSRRRCLRGRETRLPQHANSGRVELGRGSAHP